MDETKINGIINVLKPPGMTSFDVIGHLRKVLNEKKIGHTGTLDPGAAGVLPVCVGNATRAAEFLTEKDKLYRAELSLGVETDTQDSFGAVLKTADVNVTEEQILNTVKAFKGKQQQIPPMYSAIKLEGKKLYELARSGITVERKPREIEIFAIDVIDIAGNKVLLDVHCSKGTYIRTLCSDIGGKLFCGGHMSFLLRLRSGEYGIESTLTLEEISNYYRDGQLSSKILRTDSVFSVYKPIRLNAENEKRLLNGVDVLASDTGNTAEDGDLVRVYGHEDKFLALGKIINKQGKNYLKTIKFFG